MAQNLRPPRWRRLPKKKSVKTVAVAVRLAKAETLKAAAKVEVANAAKAGMAAEAVTAVASVLVNVLVSATSAQTAAPAKPVNRAHRAKVAEMNATSVKANARATVQNVRRVSAVNRCLHKALPSKRSARRWPRTLQTSARPEASAQKVAENAVKAAVKAAVRGVVNAANAVKPKHHAQKAKSTPRPKATWPRQATTQAKP